VFDPPFDQFDGPLRIAFGTQDFVTEPSFDSGIANYVHRTASWLAAMGHDVHVIALSTVDQAEFDYDGIKVHRVPFGENWLQLNRLTRYRLTTTMHLLAASSEIYRKLKQLHQQQPLHLVQFPNSSYCGLVSMLFLPVPRVLRASWYEPAWNDSDRLRRSLDTRIVALLERFQFTLSPHIYAPSVRLQKLLTEEAGLKNVRQMPSPFFLECRDWDYSVHNALTRGRKCLLFFGRFELRKGFQTLARALPRFLQEHPEASVVLVGRDKESAIAPSMAEYARSLCGDLAPRLIVIDQIPHRQLYPIIEDAHLVVLPSLIDNMPNACLEAMALGKVVIGTFEGSFDELIDDGVNGFLVSADDVNALTKKLSEAWTSPNLAEMGNAARLRIDDFLPDKTTGSLLRYYRQIVEMNPTR
jgi:glycosyltransferase involved in cell wall biosynthesis